VMPEGTGLESIARLARPTNSGRAKLPPWGS
jgi:hypothetical protein